MAVINHSTTIDGISDFTDLEGNTISWGGSDYLGFVGMWEPNPADITTSNITLSGSNWEIETLRYHSTADFTNITDANGNGGRRIEFLKLGMNSDVDLISTRVKYLDSHDGGALHDVTLGSEFTNSVYLGADRNILTTGSGHVSLVRTRGDDTVTVNSGGANHVEIGDGTNAVIVQNGGFVDTVNSGGGQNTVTVSGGSQIRMLSLHNATNTVTMQSDGGVHNFQTSHSSNTLTTDARWFGFLDSWNADNTVNIGSGGAGVLHFASDTVRSQTIDATGHIDTVQVFRTQSTELTYGAGGGGTARLGEGNDTVTTGTGFVEFIATNDGDDFVSIGSGGTAQVRLGGGNDTLAGSARDEFVSAGDGDDLVYVGTGYDLLSGGSGNDTLYGGADNDTQWGGDGADLLGGGPGHDELHGGNGDDEVWGALGDDVLSGGGGNDELGAGPGNDRVHGGDGNDGVYGGLGHDVVGGGDGDDRVFGAAGNDWLSGGAGNDTLFAGPGNDTVSYGDGEGADELQFFSVSEDKLRLDETLWLGSHGVLTAAQVISTFGADAGADYVLDFGGGDTVTLAGQAGIAASLAAAIDIV